MPKVTTRKQIGRRVKHSAAKKKKKNTNKKKKCADFQFYEHSYAKFSAVRGIKRILPSSVASPSTTGQMCIPAVTPYASDSETSLCGYSLATTNSYSDPFASLPAVCQFNDYDAKFSCETDPDITEHKPVATPVALIQVTSAVSECVPDSATRNFEHAVSECFDGDLDVCLTPVSQDAPASTTSVCEYTAAVTNSCAHSVMRNGIFETEEHPAPSRESRTLMSVSSQHPWHFCIDSTGIQVMFITGGVNPLVEKSIFLDTVGNIRINILGKPVPPTSIVWRSLEKSGVYNFNLGESQETEASLSKIVNHVEKLRVCCGNQEASYAYLWNDVSNAKTEEHFDSLGNKCWVLRSTNCELLVTKSRCEPCHKINGVLRKSHSRKSNADEVETENFKRPHSSMNNTQLKQRLQFYSKRVKLLNSTVQRMAARLEKSTESAVSLNPKIFVERSVQDRYKQLDADTDLSSFLGATS